MELAKLESRIKSLDALLDDEISSVERLMARILRIQNLAADIIQYVRNIDNRVSTLFIMETAIGPERRADQDREEAVRRRHRE